MAGIREAAVRAKGCAARAWVNRSFPTAVREMSLDVKQQARAESRAGAAP